MSPEDIQRMKVVALQDYVQQLQAAGKTRQVLPQMTPGQTPGGAGGSVTPMAGLTRFDIKGQGPVWLKTNEKAMFERLEQMAEPIAARIFHKQEMPTLTHNPTVVPLMQSRAEIPRMAEMFGHAEPRFGAKLDFKGPATFEAKDGGYLAPVRGVGAGYATAEDAKRAALINALNFYGQMEKSPDLRYMAKPVKPQISEFASPESARKSWRLF